MKNWQKGKEIGDQGEGHQNRGYHAVYFKILFRKGSLLEEKCFFPNHWVSIAILLGPQIMIQG